MGVMAATAGEAGGVMEEAGVAMGAAGPTVAMVAMVAAATGEVVMAVTSAATVAVTEAVATGVA